jgi:hypothetical protein
MEALQAQAAILVHTGFTRLYHPGRRNPRSHWRQSAGYAGTKF